MNEKHTQLDWQLWFYWIMATTLGWLAGNLLFYGLPFLAAGVAIAAFQWSILFKRMPKAWQWLPYTFLGWFAGYIGSLLLFPQNAAFWSGPLVGLAAGFTQWLYLRNKLELAWWWIPINILAWTTGISVLPGALTSGTLPGSLTGLTLIILLHNTPEKKTNSKKPHESTKK